MDDRVNFAKHFVDRADALEAAAKNARSAGLPEPEPEVVESRRKAIEESGTQIPRIIPGDEFPAKYDIPPPEYLIDGMMQKSELVLLHGPSKGYKSWIWHNIAVAVASGLPIFNRETRQGRVLVCDFELNKNRICERLIDISLARGLDGVPADLHLWPLNRSCYNLDLVIEALKAELLDKEPYSLLLIDPIYMLQTGDSDFDENNARHITTLMQTLEKMVVDTDCTLGVCHHQRKQSREASDSHEMASGSGVFQRFPSMSISAQRHEEEDCMVLSFLCRNQKSPDDLVVQFDAPLIKSREDLDPTRKRRPGAAPRPRVDPKDVILRFVPKEPMRIARGDLYSICSQQEIKEPDFLEALEQLDGSKIQSHHEGGSTTYSILEL